MTSGKHRPGRRKTATKILERLTVPAIYGGITLLISLPLVFAPGTQLLGGLASDACSHVWGMNWAREALFYQGRLMFLDAPSINYPLGGSLISCHPLNDLLSIPLQVLFGPLTAFNLILLFHVILAAWGAYALARYLTGDRRAAFVAGVVFAFCPFLATFAVASGGTEMVSVGWLPLGALFGLRTLREGGWKNPVLLALTMVAIDLTCVYYVAVMVLFCAGLVLYHGSLGTGAIDALAPGTPPRAPRTGGRLAGVARLIGAAGLTLLLAGPHLVLLMRAVDSPDSLLRDQVADRPTLFGSNDPPPPPLPVEPGARDDPKAMPTGYPPNTVRAGSSISQQGYSSVYLLNVIRPGGGSLQHHDSFCEFRLDPYLGLVALALAAIALWGGPRRATVFWVVVWACFTAFAIGPDFNLTASHQLGRLLAPARLLGAVFFLNPPGHEAVYYVMSMLALAVLSAMGTKVLLERFPLRRPGAVTAAIAAVVLADYALLSSRPFPLQHERVDLPEAYLDKVHSYSSTPMLELPMWRDGTMVANRGQFCYQALHHQPIAGSIAAGIPYTLEKNLLTLRLISEEFGPRELDIEQRQYQDAIDWLRADGFRYVIVDSSAYAEASWQRVEPLLAQHLGQPIEYPDGYRVYSIEPY